MSVEKAVELRKKGELEKSNEIFEKAMMKFDDNSLKVFYAMTLYNLEEYSSSMKILLRVISETTKDKRLSGYSKAGEFYSDKLDKVFK